jgi:hypothetical protein
VAVQSADPAQPNLAILPAWQTGLTVAVVAGQETPEWQGWKAIKNHQQGEYAPAPTALVEWQARRQVRLVTVLYPTPAGETCPIRAVSAPPDLWGLTVHLTLVDGQTISLNETDYADKEN